VKLDLIPLDCPACGSAMAGDPHDLIFFCAHCASAALLDEQGLQTTESSALLPSPGKHAEVWKPAWIIEAHVEVDQRIRSDGRRTEGWQGEKSFIIPALQLPLIDMMQLARALTAAAGDVGELPREPIRGGTLALEDAITLARHIVIGDEIRKPDKLASVQVDITEKAHRLAAIPFERDEHGLRCAVTGVLVSAGK
jgi:hypothetical protein